LLLIAMKLAALVVVLAVVSLPDARAEEASAKTAGSCMPIGLTASGEVVFPWDCRAIIEKQRGPVSVNVPPPSADPSTRDQAAEKPAAQQPEQSATAAPVQPQMAVATPPVQDTTATVAHPAPRLRPKRTLAAVAGADKKHQVAAPPQPSAQPQSAAPSQPQSVSAITRALNALK
jgi:hypothetical protein